MYRIILIVLAVGLFIFLSYPAQHHNDMPLSPPVQESSNTAIKSQIMLKDSSEVVFVNANSSGEVQAMLSAQELFEVAKQLYFCRAVPKNDVELSLWLDKAKESGEPHTYIENVLGRYSTCIELDATEQNYAALLIEAAEQGADDAVALFWSLSDTEYFESMNFMQMSRDETIANRYKFIEKKFELAHAVALKGGEKSLNRLIRDYQHFDPFTKGQSYYKSVAYADFALATTQNNDFYQKIDWIKQRLLRTMSHEEIEQAQSLTERLLSEAINGRN